MFTLGFASYGRVVLTRSVSYVTANGPARLSGPRCLVVQPSHVTFNICNRTFSDGFRVQSSGANGVVYMKYGGRSDNGEPPPRRRPSTPTLRLKGAEPSGRIITSLTSLGLVVGMNHAETESTESCAGKELGQRIPSNWRINLPLGQNLNEKKLNVD